jgi:cytochrome subunit of sulfide dehydrogenase
MKYIHISAGAALGLGILLSAGISPAVAQSADDVKVLAGTCANCHGTDGRSPGPIASIAGRPESALRAQLQAFKAETPPPGTTIMNRLAKGYTDEQIDALAKHFSQIKAQAPAAAKGKQ